MKPSELRELYSRACDAKGYEVNEGQLKIWRSTLGFLDARDLQKAINKWFGSQTGFPMPAELQPLIEQARRTRVGEGAAKTYLVDWRCPTCGAGMTGWLPMSADATRTCKSSYGALAGHGKKREMLNAGDVCGSVMAIVRDERVA